MENLVGKITASLLESEPDRIGELVERINLNVKPPEPVQAGDIYIRAMYIVSDKVNSYGGCFPPDEHEHLIELLIDSPVLVGHRKDSLPIARNFYAEAVRRDDGHWVKVYFYWLKNSEPGEELQKNIDSGIYKECSISFIFSFPECSICGSDIRECRHRPLSSYEVDGVQKEAYFNYRKIEKVLETSLVYRGAVENTAITKELLFTNEDQAEGTNSGSKTPEIFIHRIWNTDPLGRELKYLVMPAHESLPIRLIHRNNSFSLNIADAALKSPRLEEFLKIIRMPDGNYMLDGRLLGYRGKERQTPQEIESFLAGQKSSVRRLELKIIDLIEQDGQSIINQPGRERYRRLVELLGEKNPYLTAMKEGSGANLSPLIEQLSTRYGVILYAAESDSRYFLSRRFIIPAVIDGKAEVNGRYRYHISCNYGNNRIPVTSPITSQFDLEKGRTIELEVRSLRISGNQMNLVQPRLVQFYRRQNQADDISLLAASKDDPENRYELIVAGADVILQLYRGRAVSSLYRLPRFSQPLLLSGRRFLADKIELSDLHSESTISSGTVRLTGQEESIRLEADSPLNGTYFLRPILLHGKRRFLFYRAGQSSQEVENERE